MKRRDRLGRLRAPKRATENATRPALVASTEIRVPAQDLLGSDCVPRAGYKEEVAAFHHGKLRTIKGPSALVTGSGKCCHARIAKLNFAFVGVRFGTLRARIGSDA